MGKKSCSYGDNFRVTIGGTSHGPEIWVSIKGIDKGTVIDFEELDEFLRRRSASSFSFATDRKEDDSVDFTCGMAGFAGTWGIVTGDEVRASVKNKDARPGDYETYRSVPRPGHADFCAVMKDGADAEIEGGGRFSGRLTVGLCIAGGIAKQILKKKGISVSSAILEIAGDREATDFEDIIGTAKARGDSVGGIIECVVTGLEAGSCGDNLWDGLESRISASVFGVPAVKGIEFGSGFNSAALLGSENNDEFYYDEEGKVKTKTNRHGGILGGIASGMPLVFRCAVKPTPSIAREQSSVNLRTGENVKISVKGRHDPCIVPRALPCIESAAAIALLDALLEEEQDH